MMVSSLSTQSSFVHMEQCIPAGECATPRRGAWFCGEGGFWLQRAPFKTSVSILSAGGNSLMMNSGRKGEAHCRIEEDCKRVPKGLISQKQSHSHTRRRGRSSSRPGLNPKERGITFSTGYWRLFGVEVPLERDFGKDHHSVSQPLLEAISAVLDCSATQLPASAFSVVRKSLDARKDPLFVYTVDLDAEEFTRMEPAAKAILCKLRTVPGKTEFSASGRNMSDLVDRFQDVRAVTNLHISSAGQFEAPNGNGDSSPVLRSNELPTSPSVTPRSSPGKGASVVVVGGGPAGLFATLALAEAGVEVTLLERGQPVESRGRDIGKLAVRRLLDPNSNLCFGEGGAGTWSDGKLTTRIGKNSSSVQTVLTTLVRFGAPPKILVDGKPHVGTDRLVRILRNLRIHLLDLNVKIRFGTLMNDLEVHDGRVRGVWASEVNGQPKGLCGELLKADAVVLAVGHSARDVYDKLLHQNVSMAVKPFAVGFRIEHPQDLVNEMQYNKWATEVQRGRGKLPVADYKLAADLSSSSNMDEIDTEKHSGRSCFSFCMCPGGQVVLTSTSATELCVNGMSFSNRSSRWANAALVVPVSAPDFLACGSGAGPLAGVAFQRKIEKEAAVRGGGNFTCPVQRVTDFLDDRLSGGVLPSSSYRLGVKEAILNDLLPTELTDSLKKALMSFDRQLPGFITEKALLHGIETRTSSPVRIDRRKDTFESTSLPGLYPIGEGAGHAGGIVSAAVDGMLAGLALAKQLSPRNVALQCLSV